MYAQFYLAIDVVTQTEEQVEAFYQMCSETGFNFVQLNEVNGKRYYLCMVPEEGNIPSVVAFLEGRNAVVNGCWDENGIKVLNQDFQPLYPFDLALHISFTPDIVTLDWFGEGETDFTVVTTPATEFDPIMGFAGWELCSPY